jgi:hypothetical protein
MDYTFTCLESTVSTNISYCVFILIKSLSPGVLEKSSITDQISQYPSWHRYPCPSDKIVCPLQKQVSVRENEKHSTSSWTRCTTLSEDCFVQTLDGLRVSVQPPTNNRFRFVDEVFYVSQMLMSHSLYTYTCLNQKRFLWGPLDVGSDSLHTVTVLSLPVDFCIPCSNILHWTFHNDTFWHNEDTQG